MVKKFVRVALLLSVLSGSSGWGFPARDVQVVTDKNYFGVVRDCIQKARSSILVMMFEASYYQKHARGPSTVLIKELIAAKKRGVEVKVILERGEGQERASLRNIKTAALLSQGGVAVAYDPEDITTHSKMLIIDGEVSIVGSTNWTYSALEKNHEASLVVRSSEVAKELQDYFHSVWKTCSHSN